MLILSWDQEKIVVLNLVLFCYFLRYLVGDSIETTLSQRKEVLLNSLLVDLNSQIALLTNLATESKFLINTYHTLVLSLLKKILVKTNNMILSAIEGGNSYEISKFDFVAVQLALQAAYDTNLSKQLEQNLFVSSQITLEVFPTFREGSDSE